MKMAMQTDENLKPVWKRLGTETALQVDLAEQDVCAGYPMEMLKKGNIQGLAPVSAVQVDKHVRLSYLLTSMQGMEQVLARRRLSRSQLLALLSEMAAAFQQTHDHLLDPENILLDTKWVFVDPVTLSPRFLYLPRISCTGGDDALRQFLRCVLTEHVRLHESTHDAIVQRLLQRMMDPFHWLDLMAFVRAETAGEMDSVSMAPPNPSRKLEGIPPSSAAGVAGQDPGMATEKGRHAKVADTARPSSAGLDRAVLLDEWMKMKPAANRTPHAIPSTLSAKGVSEHPGVIGACLQAWKGTEFLRMSQSLWKVTGLLCAAVVGSLTLVVYSRHAGMLSGRDGVLNGLVLTTLCTLSIGWMIHVWRTAFKRFKESPITVSNTPVSKAVPGRNNRSGTSPAQASGIRSTANFSESSRNSAVHLSVSSHQSAIQYPESSRHATSDPVDASRQPASEGTETAITSSGSAGASGMATVESRVQPTGSLLEKAGTVMLSSGGAHPCLVRTGAAGTERIPLRHFPFLIGRLATQVDLSLPNPAIGKMHAEIHCAPVPVPDMRLDIGNAKGAVEYLLFDMSSRNGSFVNDSPLEPNQAFRLKNGDMLRFANETFHFECRPV